MTPGLTFDTGALIGLERRHAPIASVLALATKRGRTITVPSAVVAEWWRSRSDRCRDMLLMVHVEELDQDLAKLAGEAIAATRGATVVDAIVMASAARRGDFVYTSDVPDLTRLRGFFPCVRVLHA